MWLAFVEYKYRSLAQLVEQLAFNQFVEGSNPSRPTTFFKVSRDIYLGVQNRSLAQLVEQLAFNQFVEGSNPSRPTTSSLHLLIFKS